MPKPGQQNTKAVSPTKRKQKPLVKVVVGNKKMMAQENIVVSQAVDDYMREMEVRICLKPASYRPQACLKHSENALNTYGFSCALLHVYVAASVRM